MKRICIFVLSGCLLAVASLAHAKEPSLKLTGIVSLPGLNCALLEIQKTGRSSWRQQVTLREGQLEGGVAVLQVKPGESVVEVSDNGRKILLGFEQDAQRRDAQEEVRTTGQNLQLHGANLQQVLELYGEIKGRTVLPHPALKSIPTTLNAEAQTRIEAAAVLEKLFEQQGMAVILDGDKFVMIVPASLTNSALPRSDKIVSDSRSDSSTNAEASNLRGTINFMGAEMRQVLALYAELSGRKFNTVDSQYSGLPIRFRSQTPLTKAEAVYALETLIEWSGFEIVPIDEKEFKVVPAARSVERRN